jgi:hypothetical protein
MPFARCCCLGNRRIINKLQPFPQASNLAKSPSYLVARNDVIGLAISRDERGALTS